MSIERQLLVPIAIALLVAGCAGGGTPGPILPEISPTAAPALPPPESPAGPPSSGSGAGEPGDGTAASPQGSGSEPGPSSGDGAGSGELTAAGASGGSSSAGGPPSGSVRTADERAAELEADLARSLAEFDRRLAREQGGLARERADREPASTAAAGGVGGGSFGGGEGTRDGETRDGQWAESGDRSAAAEDGAGGAKASADGRRQHRRPADVGDGADDDIVARQLREAALSEDDPALRERLWDEYRAYKSGKPVERAPEGAPVEEPEAGKEDGEGTADG